MIIPPVGYILVLYGLCVILWNIQDGKYRSAIAAHAPWSVPLFTWLAALIEPRASLVYDAALEISAFEKITQEHSVIARWRLTVANRGSAAACNVKMRLCNIVPRPQYAVWQAVYPYAAKNALGRYECGISPNDKEYYDLLSSWPNGEGKLIIGGLDPQSEWPVKIYVEPTEKWELQYEITADNAQPVLFSLLMYIAANTIVIERNL